MARSATPPLDTSDLSAWLDGELPEDEAVRLEEQLQLDPELKAELDELEAVVGFVRARAPAHAPDGFTVRLLERIEAEHGSSTEHAWWRRPFGIRLEGWAAALAAAAVLLLVLSPLRPRPTVPRAEQTVSPAALEGTAALKKQLPLDASPTKGSPPPPAPLGKSNVQRKVAEPQAGTPLPLVVDGTAVPPDLAAPLPLEIGPELPEIGPELADAPPRTETAAVRYTIRSADPEMKRKFLSTVARYGAVMTDGPEPKAAMASAVETLQVFVREERLPEFQRELEAAGFSVTHDLTNELVSGDLVELEVTLQQQ